MFACTALRRLLKVCSADTILYDFDIMHKFDTIERYSVSISVIIHNVLTKVKKCNIEILILKCRLIAFVNS